METPQPPRIFSAWDLLFLAALAALAVFFLVLGPSLPDPVPIHFDALGRANGWTPKAGLPLLIFLPPVVLWAVLALVGAATAVMPKKAAAGGTEAVRPLRGLAGAGMCVLMGGCLATPLLGIRTLWAGLVVFFLCLGLGIILLVRASWRALAGDPQARACWRGGMFYVNRQDRRLWVEKRQGMGWTLNYGHPAAAYVTVLILAGVVGVAWLVQMVARR